MMPSGWAARALEALPGRAISRAASVFRPEDLTIHEVVSRAFPLADAAWEKVIPRAKIAYDGAVADDIQSGQMRLFSGLNDYLPFRDQFEDDQVKLAVEQALRGRSLDRFHPGAYSSPLDDGGASQQLRLFPKKFEKGSVLLGEGYDDYSGEMKGLYNTRNLWENAESPSESALAVLRALESKDSYNPYASF